MEPNPDKPNQLVAVTKADLESIFQRGRDGEFKCIALKYGRKPGDPFAVVGILWPKPEQGKLL